MIRFRCPECGRRLSVFESHAGKQGKCPRCGAAVQVPALETAAPPAAAQPRAARQVGIPLPAPATRRGEGEEAIDMTAMVDIVFFLLIFFMVASLTAQQAVIDLPAAKAEEGSGSTSTARTVSDFEADEAFVIVRIDADNAVWVDDVLAPSPADLVTKLKAAAAKATPSDDAASLLVVADGDAQHGTAVMVLDSAHEVGIRDVRLSVQDES